MCIRDRYLAKNLVFLKMYFAFLKKFFSAGYNSVSNWASFPSCTVFWRHRFAATRCQSSSLITHRVVSARRSHPDQKYFGSQINFHSTSWAESLLQLRRFRLFLHTHMLSDHARKTHLFVVCLSVCHIRYAPCLNRLADLDTIWQVYLWGLVTHCVT